MKSKLSETNPIRVTVIYTHGSLLKVPTVFEFPWQSCLTLEQAKEVAGGFDDSEFLETMFRQCNHVDGNEWIAGKQLRSMSVGDVVIIDKFTDRYEPDDAEYYVCDMMGWKKLAELEIVP